MLLLPKVLGPELSPLSNSLLSVTVWCEHLAVYTLEVSVSVCVKG